MQIKYILISLFMWTWVSFTLTYVLIPAYRSIAHLLLCRSAFYMLDLIVWNIEIRHNQELIFKYIFKFLK